MCSSRAGLNYNLESKHDFDHFFSITYLMLDQESTVKHCKIFYHSVQENYQKHKPLLFLHEQILRFNSSCSFRKVEGKHKNLGYQILFNKNDQMLNKGTYHMHLVLLPSLNVFKGRRQKWLSSIHISLRC